jgi:serine/threonine protein kinase
MEQRCELLPVKETASEAVARALEKALPLAEGMYGIIVRLDKNDSNLVELLKAIDPDYKDGSPVASKLFKVRRSGQESEHEFEMQMRAYQILKKYSEKGKQYAIVPKPFLASKSKIPAALRGKIAQSGFFDIGEQSDADILIMDEVEGLDFKTMLLKKVVLLDTELDAYKDGLDSMSYKELSHLVSEQLGLEWNDSSYLKDDFFVEPRNAEKILMHLQKAGYVVPADIVEQVRNTIELLNSHGFYHRDLHDRNIMIDQNGFAYIIDFGEAVDSEGHVADPYESDNANLRYRNDHAFHRRVAKYCETEQEQRLKFKKGQVESVNRFIERACSKNSKFKKAWDEFKSSVESDTVASADDILRLLSFLSTQDFEIGGSKQAQAAGLIYILEKFSEAQKIEFLHELFSRFRQNNLSFANYLEQVIIL